MKGTLSAMDGVNLLMEMSQNAYSLLRTYDWDSITKKAHEQCVNLIGE